MKLVNTLFLLSVLVSGCAGVDGVNGEDGQDGVDGSDGRSFLVDVITEDPGETCQMGGQKVVVGEDFNGDGQLSPLEITKETVICQGSVMPPGLVETATEPVGENCELGGVVIRAGVDTDFDGGLSPDETTSTHYVCDGQDGQDGVDGEDGEDGQNGLNGEDGLDGSNGFNTLIATVNESAGVNCVAGGVRINAGLDTNRNGVLDSGEVTTTRYVCNGTGGSSTSPVVVNAFTGNDAPTYFNGVAASTLISATITTPAPGAIVATASGDAYCDTWATTSTTYCATADVIVYAAITTSPTLSAEADFPTVPGFYFGYLAKDVTNNLQVTGVFNAPAAGSYTYYFRMRNSNSGRLGVWRQRMTLVYLPN